jgi:hypothetical protein
MEEKMCAHPGCGCPVPPTRDYCDDYCARAAVRGTAMDAEKRDDDSCGCGHVSCMHGTHNVGEGKKLGTSVEDK